MPYRFPISEFPTLAELGDALPLVRDLYLDQSSVPTRDVKLAVINVAAFVAGMTESAEPPIFGAASATQEDAVAAFAQAIGEATNPATMNASPVGSPWLVIVAPIVLELLKKFITR